MKEYLPEGQNCGVLDWSALMHDRQALDRAIADEEIFEARAIACTSGHDLMVEFNGCTGRMPREECALGISNGSVREIAIISRVNKTVCFCITGAEKSHDGSIIPILSRTKVQKRVLDWLLKNKHRGDIVDATVTHLEPFGAFVDIGCGISSLIATANLSVSRIDHPSARVRVGQHIKAIIRDIDYETGRFSLSQKELLGTWEENASQFGIGCTVTGIIRSIESYGVFIELTPNLSGLAEFSGQVEVNTRCAVYIKNIVPERMKIKLSVINACGEAASAVPLHYYITSGSLRRWVYSPPECSRIIETEF